MKKIVLALLIIHSSLLIVYAQWQTDVRLTSDLDSSYVSSNNARSIAADGNYIHVIWYNSRTGEIYYKHSTDSGLTWEAGTKLNNNYIYSYFYYPSIAASGSTVHAMFVRNHNAYDVILYKRSTDGGNSWSGEMQFTSSSSTSRFPSISASGLGVYAVWQYWVSSVRQVEYARSSDGGIVWSTTQLTNSTSDLFSPAVSAIGQAVHVVWYAGGGGIYYKRSTDGGINWGTETRLSNNQAISLYPSVSSSGTSVQVAWQDSRDGNYDIYFKRSTDFGVSWGPDIRLTNNYGDSYYPSISASSQNLHVVWQDNRDANYEVYYKRSTDGGISWGADTRLTNDPAASQNPTVSLFGSAVHVAWEDNRDGNFEVYYKRDPTGNPIGIKTINSEIPKEFSVYQNYPNPFNPSTRIKFEIPNLSSNASIGDSKLESNSKTEIKIYDVLGREVAELVNEHLSPGVYEVEWDAANYPSGVYYYKLVSGDPSAGSGQVFTETKKMILVK